MLTVIRSGAHRVVSVAVVAGASLLACGCGSSQEAFVGRAAVALDASAVEVIPASDVLWGALNPARGDKGPRAADLWGDRTESGSTGFLVRFAEGFSSPPHTHNVTYRGVVIEGLVHNDDPSAADLWMPTGSYWTQPAGEVHITSAKGDGRLAYIEIQRGPYLVLPPEEASDNGERAVNLHASNMVWLDASSVARIDASSRVSSDEGPRVSYLWGDPQDEAPSAAMVELPAGFAGMLVGDGASLRAVVIDGRVQLQQVGDADGVTLDPGSYVGSTNASGQRISLTTAQGGVLYVRCEGTLSIVGTQHQ